MLGKILAKHHGFRCSVLFAINEETGEIDPNNQNNIPGMHLLEDADLVVMALRFRQLPDDQMKFFDDYLNAGKPIIGLRTSTHAFRYPKDSSSEYKEYSFNSKDWAGGFGKQVLGETWISHHGHHKVESTRGVINPKHASHSILEGVSDIWGPTDVYGVRELPKNAVVLVHGQVLTGMKPDDPPVVGKKNEPMMPLVWIRNHETESGSQARIFCTTMGSSTDFENAGLRRLLVNACYWAMGMEQDILDESKVDIVGEFNPTDYGFNSFKKGMKPSDYDLKD